MKMHALVIHAPRSKCDPVQGNCFANYFRTGVGRGYVVGPANVNRLTIPGSPLVLLDKEAKLRAEGHLIRLARGARTPQQRYDVYFEGQRRVPYKPEILNHYGVALLDC